MESEVRERKSGPKVATTSEQPNATNPRPPTPSHPPTQRITLTDILRILALLLLLNSLLSYFITNTSLTWNYRPWFTRRGPLTTYLRGPVHLTDADLTAYDGTDPAKPIYLALNGTIYDVTAGRHIYGPGGSYHVFAGRDAARGFITGCFAADATPDLRGAEWTYVPAEIPAYGTAGVTGEGKRERERAVRRARGQVREVLEGWARMFRGEGGKGYFEVGRVRREEGWLEGVPVRALCAAAERGRPKGKGVGARDRGEAYRGG